MEKKISDETYKMTNDVFKHEMELLFDLEKKVDYNVALKQKNGNKKRIAIVYDVDGCTFIFVLTFLIPVITSFICSICSSSCLKFNFSLYSGYFAIIMLSSSLYNLL